MYLQLRDLKETLSCFCFQPNNPQENFLQTLTVTEFEFEDVFMIQVVVREKVNKPEKERKGFSGISNLKGLQRYQDNDDSDDENTGGTDADWF